MLPRLQSASTSLQGLGAIRNHDALHSLDALELDLHGGEHAWGANKSVEFFRRHLKAKWDT